MQKKNKIQYALITISNIKNVNKYIHMEKLKETITKNNDISRGVREYCYF